MKFRITVERCEAPEDKAKGNYVYTVQLVNESGNMHVGYAHSSSEAHRKAKDWADVFVRIRSKQGVFEYTPETGEFNRVGNIRGLL